MQTLGWYSAFYMRNESKADKLASHNKVGSRRGASLLIIRPETRSWMRGGAALPEIPNWDLSKTRQRTTHFVKWRIRKPKTSKREIWNLSGQWYQPLRECFEASARREFSTRAKQRCPRLTSLPCLISLPPLLALFSSGSQEKDVAAKGVKECAAGARVNEQERK